MNGNTEQDYLKGIISYTLIDEKGAIKAGQLLGASFMLKGSYVFPGQDIFINITLIDVETGNSVTFSKRGYQGNTVHALSEKLLKHMTGKDYSLQRPPGSNIS